MILKFLNWVERRFRSVLLRYLIDIRSRNVVLNFYRIFLKRLEKYNYENSIFKIENPELYVKKLRSYGYAIFDNPLPLNSYNSIIESLNDKLCHDVYHPEFGKFKPINSPEITHVAEFSSIDLINNKAIMELANDPGILEIVSNFLGNKPTISNIAAWWSFKGKKQAKEAQNFHRDNDDFKFLKLFVYLTDVDENSGPHVYVKNTSNSNKLKKIKRYSDDEIESVFGVDNILTFTGKKCTVFLADTYGFHKGLLPFSNDRLLLQIEYSLFPIGYQNYNPLFTNDIYYLKFDKYINRLLFKFK